MKRGVFETTVLACDGKWSDWLRLVCGPQRHHAAYELENIYRTLDGVKIPNSTPRLQCSLQFHTGTSFSLHDKERVYMFVPSSQPETVYYYTRSGVKKKRCWTGWNNTTQWPWNQPTNTEVASRVSHHVWSIIMDKFASKHLAIKLARFPVSKWWLVAHGKNDTSYWKPVLTNAIAHCPPLRHIADMVSDETTPALVTLERIRRLYHSIKDSKQNPLRNHNVKLIKMVVECFVYLLCPGYSNLKIRNSRHYCLVYFKNGQMKFVGLKFYSSLHTVSVVNVDDITILGAPDNIPFYSNMLFSPKLLWASLTQTQQAIKNL